MRRMCGLERVGLALVMSALWCGAQPARAATVTATHNGHSATITAPDRAAPGTDFDVVVVGDTDGYAFKYSAWEDADWSYDENHVVIVASGTKISVEDWWGITTPFTHTYTISGKPESSYTYTFVFGPWMVHNGSPANVAVDITVAVGPALCGTGWNPPLADRAKAGRVVPLKFTGFDCASGNFLHDEGVHVEVLDGDGIAVASWGYVGNPHLGVDIDDDGEQYHVNWDTDAGMAGTYTVRAVFSSGDELTRLITLSAAKGKEAAKRLTPGLENWSWGEIKSVK